MPDHTTQFEQASRGLELANAILLYKPEGERPLSPIATERNREPALATIHPVKVGDNGVAEIGSGRPMTRADLRHWTDHLSPATAPQLLPRNVLVLHKDMMAWWIPAARRNAYFNLTSPPEGLQALYERKVTTAPYPAHVLIATRGRLAVFALPTSKRPSADTQLLHSPILNVFLDGTLCWGNIASPKTLDPETIPQWEAALFDSWSTHPNIGQDGTVRGKDGLVAIWDDIVAFERKRFPISRMKPFRAGTTRHKQNAKTRTSFTLADAIARETSRR